ncbi:helix-turn-helix domain-containing protein [Olivibacter sp. 47]|uniref:helix-turn-helix domain-containing protein n=1 Tax=Olivibacter sp. 47 TaxID=3056486 RepID=UPI0025A33610|nr:helix-turn-helix domain-containing protein [Olivibacter sp. 47]MDM8176870.1 helix-turn-helix domain-containing protein [Olivibacter sp. 47]
MNFDPIIALVADEYGVTVQDIKSPSRKRQISEARQMTCYILRHEGCVKLSRALNRHHTTVVMAIQVMEDLLSYDRKIANRYKNLMIDIENQQFIQLKKKKIEDEMTVKLNINQLEGVTLLVTAALNAYKPDNLGESLLYEIVDKVNDRLKAKIKKRQFENRVGTSITLSSIEAKAFHCWYNQIVTIFQEDSYRYERTVANAILNQIDKVYA